ncbi:MAG: DUF4349 domain-containing protein [Chloroflexi bacterium]|nr:DUF4349 domain-containing protein [Chloroflexota bacterium]
MLRVRTWGKYRVVGGLVLLGAVLLLVATCTGGRAALRQTDTLVTLSGGPSAGAEAPPRGTVTVAEDADRMAPAVGAPAPYGEWSGAKGDMAEPGAAPSSGGQPQSPLDRMIIYTTTLALTVNDVPQAVEEVTRLTQNAGGLVSASTLRQEGEYTLATLTIRVPALSYPDTMAALRRLAVDVTSEQGQTKDVTEEFTDLEAQVRNLQVTEAQLQELMKRATTIDEILRVQAQLSTVRGQIERLQGRMNYLRRSADLATITVALTPVGFKPKQPTPTGWDPVRIAREAWEDSLAFLQIWAGLGIRILVFSWWLVPPALAAWAIWTALRTRRRAAPQA